MSTYTITRSATIPAPPEQVFPHVNDLKKWVAWSPWEGKDPNLERTYTDNPVGPGATYGWKGNKEVGEGSMTITSVEENARIDMDLNFLKPFKDENKVTFSFAPTEGGTTMTWSMAGRKTVVWRILNFILKIEKMVSDDFDKGMSQLAAVFEE